MHIIQKSFYVFLLFASINLYSINAYSNRLPDEASTVKGEEMNTWFSNKDCSQLEINKHQSISKHDIVQTVTISNQNTLNNIINRIDAIPANGDMMVSFGSDAPFIELIFSCNDQKQSIQIISEKFKTPSTGFNSEENEDEKLLYKDIDSLLFPEFNKPLLKTDGLEHKFSDFSITYKGTEKIDHAPEIISTNTDTFLIKDKQGQEQIIDVKSGQIPPSPIDITINKTKIKLTTYEATDTTIKLYPDYFIITKTGLSKILSSIGL